MGAQKKLSDVILRNLGTVLKQFLVKVTARGQRTQSEKDVEYIAIEMVFIKTCDAVKAVLEGGGEFCSFKCI